MKKIFLFTCIFFVSVFLTIGQTDTPKVFFIVEEMPMFPGGEIALFEYLVSNLNYPLEAMNNGIEGIVYVGFIVETDGSISNVKINRGFHFECDEEAMRIIRNMPNWKPAKNRGAPVRVEMNLPVSFTLTSHNTKNTKKKGK